MRNPQKLNHPTKPPELTIRRRLGASTKQGLFGDWVPARQQLPKCSGHYNRRLTPGALVASVAPTYPAEVKLYTASPQLDPFMAVPKTLAHPHLPHTIRRRLEARPHTEQIDIEPLKQQETRAPLKG